MPTQPRLRRAAHHQAALLLMMAVDVALMAVPCRAQWPNARSLGAVIRGCQGAELERAWMILRIPYMSEEGAQDPRRQDATAILFRCSFPWQETMSASSLKPMTGLKPFRF